MFCAPKVDEYTNFVFVEHLKQLSAIYLIDNMMYSFYVIKFVSYMQHIHVISKGVR